MRFNSKSSSNGRSMLLCDHSITDKETGCFYQKKPCLTNATQTSIHMADNAADNAAYREWCFKYATLNRDIQFARQALRDSVTNDEAQTHMNDVAILQRELHNHCWDDDNREFFRRYSREGMPPAVAPVAAVAPVVRPVGAPVVGRGFRGSGPVHVSIASQRRQAAAAADVMTRGWGTDWTDNEQARNVHGELMASIGEHAPSLVGKGLGPWRGGALKAVRNAKRASIIDIRQAIGSPPNRFGIAPGLPAAPPQTARERASAAATRSMAAGLLYKSTHGRGANSRGVTGTPYNIDAFRRPRTSVTRGGTVTSSGVPMEDTMPGRNMKSALDLEALTPMQETCDVLFNVGGSDAPLEDWTNPGLRHGSRSGMMLFTNEGHRI